MSVSNILKAVGKKVDDIFPKAGSPNMKGPLQRLTGKQLENPMAIYQSAVPYHIANKYTVPLAVGGVAATAAVTGVKMNNKANMGRIEAGEGLSNMTDTATSEVSNPYLMALNDDSTKDSRRNSARLRDGMHHNINTSGAEGDLVFAMHNMR